uniref:Docking protein 1b n=1 Tax=Neogobius melanostomus TaxID=47308 RepID=A0A8C6UDV9_9GOBI
IARLEFFDSSSGAAKTRKLDKKIIRLSECISILPSLTENGPKDNMSAFCVETNDKTHVFAAEKHLAKEWMDLMCDIAFQVKLRSVVVLGRPQVELVPLAGAPDLQMSENLIYYSREEVNEFWVCVQRTEASERCGLSGSYWLKAESDALILKEPSTKRKVQVWPYKLLRRYGRDRVMFSFDAGRRCDSGPGNFTFDTKQGNEIFSLVDQAIHSKPGSADGVLTHREGTEGGAKGRSLPEPPRAPGGADEQVGLYSEPADSVRRPLHTDSLYSDPVDSIKEAKRKPPDLYSHVYDHITAEASLTQRTSEHIYDEPEGCAKGRTLPNTIYDEATAPSGQERHYSTPSLDKQSPPQGHGRGASPGIKWPKPLRANKPARAGRKEPGPPSGKHANINNNNSGELYSQVSKQKPLRPCYSPKHDGLRPDIIYDNLGNI